MLRIIRNRLKAKVEKLLAEEHTGYRPAWSTVEHTFSSPDTIEKILQHQRHLSHTFIDLKKAFDRVWYAGLWQVLRSFNVEEELVQDIQALYGNSS